MKRAGWLLLAAVLAATGCQRTGVILTVRATGMIADQLRITAAVDGQQIVRVRPTSPSTSPLDFPVDLFADFAARPSQVVFTVEALHQGNLMAVASSPSVQLRPHRVVSAEVELTAPGAAAVDLAPPAPVDLGAGDAHVSYAAVVLADKPLAYYRLDEATGTVAHDSSGHGLDGTYGAHVMRGAAGLLAGDKDGAATFNGGSWSLDGVVSVPRSPAFELSSAVSVELWMRQTIFNPDFTPLVDYGDAPNANADSPYASVLYEKTFGAYLFTNQQGSASEPAFHSVTQPAIGTTYHVVLTYDGGNIRLYVNGVLEAMKPFFGPLGGYGASGLGLGGSAAGGAGDLVFAGTLDEVAIYGTALTPQQVMTHYVAGTHP